MKKRSRITFLVLIMVIASCIFTACAKTGNQVQTDGATALVEENTYTEDSEHTQIENPVVLEEELYVVVSLITDRSVLRLYNVEKARQEDYTYNEATRFCDKYGKLISSAHIMPGKVIQMERYRSTGELRTVQISDEAWEYDGVKRFTIDEDENVFQIADTKYFYEEDLHVFSDDDIISIDHVEENDTLRVYGVGRKILTISITSGHGMLKLTNTDTFEGGWLNLSSKLYYQITKDMEIEVPEGTYMLSAAHDGYGDNKEITITRGEETVINMDELKGEGPKYCTVNFIVGVEKAVMTVDGEVIDFTQPQKIKYGIHRLEIVAEGYDTWSKRLYVNSEEATIQVAMTSDGTASTEKNVTISTESTETETETESETESETETDTETEAETESENTTDTETGTEADSEAVGDSESSDTQSNEIDTENEYAQNAWTEEESTQIEDNSENSISYIKKLVDIIDTLTGSSSISE